MKQSFYLTRFTSAEICEITGLDRAAQPDWRRRGILPKNDGKHTRSDPVQLCQLWMMKQLSDRGVGPTRSEGMAGFMGRVIVSHALRSPQAFEAPDLADRNLEAARDQVLREAVESGDARLDVVVRQPRRFVVLFADDRLTWTDDLNAVAREEDPMAPNGPVIFIDLRRQANDLLRETGPLVHLTGDVAKPTRRKVEA